MFEETGRRLRDDTGARLGVTLVGYRLCDGEYKRVPTNAAGRLPSKELGLELCVRDGLVRFYDPEASEYLPTYDESRAQGLEERTRRAVAEHRAEAAEHRAEAAEQNAREAERRAKQAEEREQATLARFAALEAELRGQHGLDDPSRPK